MPDNLTFLECSGRPTDLSAELTGRMIELIHEYDGKIPLVAAIGCVELVKDHLINECGAA